MVLLLGNGFSFLIDSNLSKKLSLAVRKDVFSGEFDPSIKDSFLERLESIKKENPFPKRSTKSKKMVNSSSKQQKKYSKKKKRKREKK